MSLWDTPVPKKLDLKAGAKLTKRELERLKPEIEEELKKSRIREVTPSALSLIRPYD